MNTAEKPIRIVIVGAGYASIFAYKFMRRRIGKMIKQGSVKITVICPKNYHSYHGFTAEALCGILSIANRQSPLRLIMRDAYHVRAHAEQINLDSREVTVRTVSNERIEKIPYDHLIIANGTYDIMQTVPGMHDNGWSLKEPGGVLSTRNHIVRMIEFAENCDDPKLIEEALNFVVAGGGFAGVEIAANIAEMLHDMRKLYPVLKDGKYRVTLVHSGASLIPQIRPRYNKLADYATRELQKWGVEIKSNVRLAEVKSNKAYLSDNSMIRTRTVISTIGQRATIFPGTESLLHTEDGLLVADEFLHVKGQANIWTAGDTAQVTRANGVIVPANALWAMMAGERLGDNLARTLQQKPLRKFTYRGLGQAASLGVGKGASELYTLQFTGWLGWFMRFFFFMFFIPSRRQAARSLFDWMLYPFLGRYQTSMESAGENILAAQRSKSSVATMEMPAVVITPKV
jgi:NADH dehydrogenase